LNLSSSAFPSDNIWQPVRIALTALCAIKRRLIGSMVYLNKL